MSSIINTYLKKKENILEGDRELETQRNGERRCCKKERR